jgi:hypothetical protein
MLRLDLFFFFPTYFSPLSHARHKSKRRLNERGGGGIDTVEEKNIGEEPNEAFEKTRCITRGSCVRMRTILEVSRQIKVS